MELIQFKEDHRQIVKNWMIKREIPDNSDTLPIIGYFAKHEGEWIAAAFLRMVEGGFGMIDSIIADPDSKRNVRSEAIDLITLALLAKAKNLNLKGILGLTLHAGTLERAIKLGFVQQPHSVMVFDLKGKSLP